MAESLNYFQFAKGEEGDFVKWRCHIIQMVTKLHFVIALSSPAVPLCSVTWHPRDENGLFIVFSHKRFSRSAFKFAVLRNNASDESGFYRWWEAMKLILSASALHIIVWIVLSSKWEHLLTIWL